MRRDLIAARECSIARAIAAIGDPWTLMFVREAHGGATRFADFEKRTGAQPSVVSDRLKRLLEAGIFERREYSSHPPRLEYQLTPMGKDLLPVLLALNTWGDAYLSNESGPPLVYRHNSCGHDSAPTVVCTHCHEPLRFGDITPEAGPGARS